jgi:LysR family transcriptional activator of nhaA
VKHPNYNHLLYFWMVVRDGGVARAAAALHVTPQTISEQIKLLEGRLKGRLLERKGRKVVPTELGLSVYQYADQIFALGQDLMRTVDTASPGHQRSVSIGVTNAVPNLIAWRAIAPLMQGPRPLRVVCQTGSLDTLVVDLAANRLDLVLATSALPADSGFRAFSHFLGECGITFFAAAPLARKLRPRFPDSLDQAPFLLPTERSPNRRVLENWFLEAGISPRIVGEFDDSALVKTFAEGGAGVFAAPSVIEREVIRQRDVRAIGTADQLRAKFYGLSMERRISHPAVAAITAQARERLFGAAGREPGAAAAADPTWQSVPTSYRAE